MASETKVTIEIENPNGVLTLQIKRLDDQITFLSSVPFANQQHGLAYAKDFLAVVTPLLLESSKQLEQMTPRPQT